MNKFTRGLTRVSIALVVIAVVAGASGAYYLNSYVPKTVAPKSFPQVDGELHIPGLDSPVDIYRDEMGIPHIYAATTHDLFFAQGYVHAQDRFWQMDFWRHIGSGRLSEMFGESQLDTDKFLRTLGWRQTAEQEYAQLGPETKAILDAYVEGVNAYIADREPIELSLEYLILTGVLNRDYTIEPWTPVHSMTWGKAMAWDLRGNMGAEIERAVLLKTLTPEQVNELFPPYPQDHPVIVSEMDIPVTSDRLQVTSKVSQTPEAIISTVNLAQLADQFALLDPLLGPAGSGIGSNSWAVSGDLTASGAAILANDPHLGIQLPSIWYQNSLHCRPKTETCRVDVAGFSFAGVPEVVIGHNDRIAWGFTNVGPDVMDLYIEKVNPDNPNQYEVNGGWVDFETRTETIRVAGADPVEITVRSTRHGPVLTETYGPLKDEIDLEADPEALAFKDKSGVSLPENYVISLAWTALAPSTPFEAIWGFNLARNWEEFREAARHFHVPAQNLLYADVDGNIGYQMPGDIPLRNQGDGRLPVPGWTDDFEWSGNIPFEELPHAFNPDSGYIATANNQVNPRDYPYLITTDWNYGFRVMRIVDMLENAPGKVDIAYIQSMQADAKNLNAETLVPVLLALELDPELASVRDQTLGSWDYQNHADSHSAAVFEQFWWNLAIGTFKDDLPEVYRPEGGSRWYEVVRNIARQPNSQWWDDRDTETTVETRDDMFKRAFEETVTQMQKEYGKDVAKWPTWGELHGATFRNATLGESGIGPIEALFNRGPFATGGGSEIVNATSWTVGESFEVDWLPSLRMIVDMGDLRNSVTVHTPGQSGHAYHPHYADMAPLWATGQYYPMLWNEQAVISNADGHLRLLPGALE
jgi:penicillin amidase